MTSTALDKKATSNLTKAPKFAFPFLDLKAQFAFIREEVMAAVARVMESQQFILGAEVQRFEEHVASKLGVRFAIGCASGTDALMLALMAAEIGPGDEVITTPFSFVATAGAIVQVGAKPVFVDMEPTTFNLDPGNIGAAITGKTRAIVPVHLFGLPADLDPILDIAKNKNLLIIEDAAQAIGARYRDRCAGTIGDFGCFSFFPSKNLGAAGDGGLITTNNPAFAERLKMVRVHGSRTKYLHEVQGINSRLDALQAAILDVKLRHLDSWTKGRADRAARYRHLIEQKDLAGFLTYPPVPAASFQHVFNQFTIRARERDQLKAFLAQSGIPTEIYYPLCLHLQPAFASLGYRSGDMPVAEAASQQVLSLPVFPELTDAQQDAVVAALEKFYLHEK
ncbi:MAG TPA: DegT/DnrJ/EryC1/StrS family aminotransferase [Candidatus Eremiobacteraceae bacterium]|nr:DegT/DnrJ/EryC1/StrS family aminotransferase [Candidatus Eremiobacteraceae bacterium]